MNDFNTEFWSVWIPALTLGGIVFCLVLLRTMSKRRTGDGSGTSTDTGHVWDEDLQELNHPLPRWWMQLFYLTIFFGLGYLVLYPGLGSYAGSLHWSSRGQYQQERASADQALKPLFDRYLAMDVATLAADPEAHAMGQRLFLNNCAQCHGSDGGGQRGFPNLRDQDWLYGGTPEAIEQSIREGRQGQMPAWGPVLGEAGVRQVANYVLSLSGAPHDATLAAAGEATFGTLCAACHGAEGKGNPAVGAPNLTDRTWLYGGSEREVVETVTNGRHGQMPAHGARLSPAGSGCWRPMCMASDAEDMDGGSLYVSAPRIYPRTVGGRYARLRWAMVGLTQAIFYGVPWLTWHGRQAVLFDIEARRFHLFGLTLWPQDFILLTGLLVCSALALFLFTALAGRLWCGYACPQTVYTSLFLWLERKIEGEWQARKRRDAGPRNRDWWRHKIAKHAAWAALAAWTGMSFVGYFVPMRSMFDALATLSLGGWATFWIVFYGFATYGNAGWMREQVCKYMCPYARFQGVMMDSATLTVTYDAVRGEPRGGRARALRPEQAGLGACVDCHLCTQVCPTGIDIREGLQIECINCGLCVDACNGVMRHLGDAPDLISYTSQEKLGIAPAGSRSSHLRRTLIYGSLLAVIAGTIVTSIATRVPVRLDVMRDRSVLSRDTVDGEIENVYRLQIFNLEDRPRRFRVSVSGSDALHLGPAAHEAEVPALGSAQIAVDVDADPGRIPHPRLPITLAVSAVDDPQVVARSSTQFFSR